MAAVLRNKPHAATYFRKIVAGGSRRQTILIAGMTLLSAGLTLAADLTTYKEAYEKALKDIGLRYEMKMSALGQQYAISLDNLLSTVKSAGDLNKTEAVMAEIKRFGKENEMPKRLSAVLEIQKLQSAYNKYASALGADRAKGIVAVTSQYDQTLEQLQRSLVSAGQLDDARAIQDERKRAVTSDEYRTAKVLADSQPTALEGKPDTYTLTVITKTGQGKLHGSGGGDRVRMFVFLGDDDVHKQELKCTGFSRGQENKFENLEFDYPLEKIDRISLLCQEGTDAWWMDSVSFQFFKGNMRSELYTFNERTGFSVEKADGGNILKSFAIPGGVQINHPYFRPRRDR